MTGSRRPDREPGSPSRGRRLKSVVAGTLLLGTLVAAVKAVRKFATTVPDWTNWLSTPSSQVHVEALEGRHAACLAEIHAGAFARPWSTFDFEQMLSERTVMGDGLFLGRKPEPCGFVLSRRAAGEAEILTIALAPELRGRGCAKPLLTRHLEELARAGIRTVHLEVDEANAPALALYRRFGFREVGRRPGYYAKPDGSRATALTMSVDL